MNEYFRIQNYSKIHLIKISFILLDYLYGKYNGELLFGLKYVKKFKGLKLYINPYVVRR